MNGWNAGGTTLCKHLFLFILNIIFSSYTGSSSCWWTLFPSLTYTSINGSVLPSHLISEKSPSQAAGQFFFSECFSYSANTMVTPMSIWHRCRGFLAPRYLATHLPIIDVLVTLAYEEAVLKVESCWFGPGETLTLLGRQLQSFMLSQGRKALLLQTLKRSGLGCANLCSSPTVAHQKYFVSDESLPWFLFPSNTR